MSDIYFKIDELINYGIKNELIDSLDEVFIRNKLLEVLKLCDYKKSTKKDFSYDISYILDGILDFAIENNIIEDNITERDLFDTKVMGLIIKRPSEIIREFNSRYKSSSKEATDYYYDLCKKSNYIRTKRVEKDLKWKVSTEFGPLDITINMSKPEKDPKEIKKALKMQDSDYPKCLLCRECEGYEGRLNYPARGNHRIIPIELNKEKWFLQYSPYVYFNEHSIILKETHTPMVIDRNTFKELLDFIEKFNHYFIGSNADLPIVGGSILSHNHYQGGNYKFSIEKAKVIEKYNIEGFKDVSLKRVKWPLSVIRVSSKDKEKLVDISDYILKKWRDYSDLDNDIVSNTDGEMHNTITPIARFNDGKYEIDLVLRNNRTTKEHPLGIFHPHKELHHIKKENIGLIEVMGLAVLPSRLNNEIKYMISYLTKGVYNPIIESHKDWLDRIKKENNITEDNALDILKKEIGLVFKEVLVHCGVFKNNESGEKGFNKFINSL